MPAGTGGLEIVCSIAAKGQQFIILCPVQLVDIQVDLNRTMKRTEVSLESLPDEHAYQESGFAAAEEKANLRALPAQLEPEQRELVLLRFAQQIKLREIAQITGLPLRTVQSLSLIHI